jgi:hypothetical protein
VLISLWFYISHILVVCSIKKIIFLGWVKEVRTTESNICEIQGEICRANTYFQSIACCFLYKAKDLSAHLFILMRSFHH